MPAYALQPSLQVTRTTAGKLLVKDVTGNYNATTNPGGYGTPNIATGDVTKCFVTLRYISSSAKYHSTNLTLATMISAGIELAPTDFAGYPLSAFPDGVFELEYIVGVNAGFRSIPWTIPTHTVVFFDNTFDPSASDGIIFEWLSPWTTYLWDKTTQLDNLQGSVVPSLPLWSDPPGSTTGWYAYFTLFCRGIQHTTISEGGYDCLIEDIAAFAFEDCMCEDHVRKCGLMNRLIMYTAIQVKTDKGDLRAAHDLAMKLASYCIKENCNC